jgi:hypothetical protein
MATWIEWSDCLINWHIVSVHSSTSSESESEGDGSCPMPYLLPL